MHILNKGYKIVVVNKKTDTKCMFLADSQALLLENCAAIEQYLQNRSNYKGNKVLEALKSLGIEMHFDIFDDYSEYTTIKTMTLE